MCSWEGHAYKYEKSPEYFLSHDKCHEIQALVCLFVCLLFFFFCILVEDMNSSDEHKHTSIPARKLNVCVCVYVRVCVCVCVRERERERDS